jgi:hypothetical protein
MSNFGTPIEEVADIEWLRDTVEQLYNVLDDISTYGDMCKSNDKSFRKLTEKKVLDLCKRIDCDGYSLFKRETNSVH